MINVAMYLRKSRADETLEGAEQNKALVHHERLLRECAAKNNLRIVGVYREIASAENLNDRPQMQHLLHAVLLGAYEAVLVVDLDRLSRGSVAEQGQIFQVLQAGNCKVITPTKTIDPFSMEDQTMYEFGMFMARREYSFIKKRMSYGAYAAVKEGQWLGAAPYGYRTCTVGKGKQKHTLEPDPETASHLKLIFKLQATGMSLADTCRELQKRGIPSPSGKPQWYTNTIVRIVTNQVYIGKTYRGMVKRQPCIKDGKCKRTSIPQSDYLCADGLHVPLVSYDLWEAARKGRKRGPKKRNREAPFVLSGLLVCERCGDPIYQREADGRGAQARVFHKVNTAQNAQACRCAAARYDWVIDKVIQLLFEEASRLQSCAKEKNSITAARKNAEELARLKRDLQKAQSMNESVFEAYEQGHIQEKELAKQSAALAKTATKLRRQIENQKRIKAELAGGGRVKVLRTAAKMLKTAGKTAKEKNESLRSFIDCIQYWRPEGAPVGRYDENTTIRIVYKKAGEWPFEAPSDGKGERRD